MVGEYSSRSNRLTYSREMRALTANSSWVSPALRRALRRNHLFRRSAILTYTISSGADTTVWCQVYSDVNVDGDGFSDATITATNSTYATLKYNEAITTWNWFGNDPSDYFDASNWSAGITPNGVDEVAMLGYQDAARTLSQPATVVTLSSDLTLGTLIFDNPNSYTICGPGTLTMQASTNDAEVFVSQGSHVIKAPVVLATSTDFYISSDNLTITSPITSASGTTLTKHGPGTLTLAGGVTAGGLMINAGTVAISHGAPASTIGLFFLAPGATLDLSSSLTIDYSGISPLASVQSAIAAGYDGGAWNGVSETSGVVTSASAASTQGTAIGYVDGSVDSGTAAAPGTVLVMYTWLGDLNLNGTVDSDDLNTMIADQGVTDADWAEGDLNFDGVVNRDDFSLLMLGAAESNGQNIDSVPEPETFALLLLAAGCLPGLRRKKMNLPPSLA